MDYKTRTIVKRVELALEDLNTAIGRIDGIDKEACSERIAHILNEAADCIFMAKQFLEKIDLSEYKTDYVGENINVRQNKTKYDKH